MPPIPLNRHRGWGLVGGGGEEEQVTTQQIWISDCWIPHTRKKQQAQIEKTQPSFQLDSHD